MKEGVVGVGGHEEVEAVVALLGPGVGAVGREGGLFLGERVLDLDLFPMVGGGVGRGACARAREN